MVEEKKPIGVIGISNICSFVLEAIVHDVDDYVISYISLEGKKICRSKGKINYTKDGRAYFVKKGVKYFLDEVMKI